MSPYRYVGEELEVFAHALQWKRYVKSQIDYALTGRVLEVGAGIGTSMMSLRSDRQVSWTCLEPDPEMADVIVRTSAALRCPVSVVRGTIADVAPSERFDAILYLDVLEHIDDDAGEVARAAALLAPGGRLVILSPAHAWLYTAFDKRIGHVRRYTRRTLGNLQPSGLACERLVYLDSAGLLVSLANRLVLRSATPTRRQVLTWDRWFVRLSRLIDPLAGYRVGKSVLAICAGAAARMPLTPGPRLGSTSVRWTLSALLVAAGAALLSSHPLLVAAAGARDAYPLGTALLLALGSLVVALWPRPDESAEPTRLRYWLAVPAFAAGLAILSSVASERLAVVFAGALDPGRADMLVIMEHAIKRLMDGNNPYAVHKVPWDAPLTYGPLLWLPHVFSYLLGFDFRIFTLVAQLVIPALCFLSAAVRLGRGDLWRAAVLFGLGAGAALHPGIRSFHEIGHTQVYWPVFAIFCVLLRQERWTSAAVCLGLLVSARTPLLALAPVFFIHLYLRKVLTIRRCAVFVAAVLLPYVPFLIVDFGAVKNGMFDTYVRVMKGFVWQSTRWAVDTYGLTGRLLEHGKQAYVELAQLLSLGIVYVCAWRSMGRGSRVEPWLALALLVFAMTTLWSVVYLYYDVWLLLVCALLVHDGSSNAVRRRGSAAAIATACVAAAVVVVSSAARNPGSAFSLDIGTPDVSGYTGGGFGADVMERDDGRTVVWIEGTTGRIRLPRAGWTDGTIRIAIRPHAPHAGAHQSVIASLNGHTLGGTPLQDGWQEISFTASRRHWIYGFNVMDLFFSYAAPREPTAGSPGTPKEFSAAIDFVVVK